MTFFTLAIAIIALFIAIMAYQQVNKKPKGK